METKLMTLNDLDAELREAMVKLRTDKNYEVRFAVWERGFDLGLLDCDDGGDFITERGFLVMNRADEERAAEGSDTAAKPQTMSEAAFFTALCGVLDIDQYDNDESDVVRLVEATGAANDILRTELGAKEFALDKALAEVARLRAAGNSLLIALDDQYLPADPKQFPPGTFEYVLDCERLEAARIFNSTE